MRQETILVSWLFRAASLLLALGIGAFVFNLGIAVTWTLVTAINHPSTETTTTFGQIFTHPMGWLVAGYSVALLFIPATIAFWLVLRSATPRLSDFIIAGLGVATLPLLAFGLFSVLGGFVITYFGPAALVAGACGGAGAWCLLHWTHNIPQRDEDAHKYIEPW